MPRKLTLDFLRKAFADVGCTLLTTEYTNSVTPVPYICICGREDKIRCDKFLQGQRCRKCGLEKIRVTIEDVCAIFSKYGCIVLDKEYKGRRKPLRFQCSCGNISSISYGYFGSRIKEGVTCVCENGRKVHYWTEEEVALKLEEAGCKYVGGYISSQENMNYICSCGHEGVIRFSSFLQGERCRWCGYKKAAEKRKVPEDEVIANCRARGLEPEFPFVYKGSSIPFNVVGSCGHRISIRYNDIGKKTTSICKSCETKLRWDGVRHDYAEVKSVIEDHYKCVLNVTEEEYKKAYSPSSLPLSYRCHCGKDQTTCFRNFWNRYQHDKDSPWTCKYCTRDDEWKANQSRRMSSWFSSTGGQTVKGKKFLIRQSGKCSSAKRLVRSRDELLFCWALDHDPNVISYRIEPLSLKYDGYKHYHPDFIVEYLTSGNELVEIKMQWKLQDADVQAKFKAGSKYAAENKMRFRYMTREMIVDILTKPPVAKAVDLIPSLPSMNKLSHDTWVKHFVDYLVSTGYAEPLVKGGGSGPVS